MEQVCLDISSYKTHISELCFLAARHTANTGIEISPPFFWFGRQGCVADLIVYKHTQF